MIPGTPERIYLQHDYDETLPEDYLPWDQLEGVTWHSGRIGRSDIEYVRGDLFRIEQSERIRQAMQIIRVNQDWCVQREWRIDMQNVIRNAIEEIEDGDEQEGMAPLRGLIGEPS